ncbi:DMT family transporter [Arsenicicoccus piscis]|uniref:Permease n=1 Tax=Arsenicicoccus piscis TaxID=673954 RepID=A0ABQ6HRR2_9MICO|nr:DMT family transporter [Arsenicicoccus piscis]MCH8629182.1 DMT family transporter [Arsenicicoccus piscis]GMA20250.1 permease [Arsenicicoccus piscis]
MSLLRGYLLVVVSAIAFGVMPVIAVFAYRHGVSVPTLLLARFGLSAVVLVVGLAALRRLRLPATRAMLVLGLMGVIYCGQSSLYFSAVQRISPALVGLLLYLYPSLVALLSSIVNHDRLTRGVVLSLVLSFVGIALCLGRIGGGSDLVGVALGAAAPFLYAIYIVLGDRVGRGVPPLVSSALVCASAALSFVVTGLVTSSLDVGAALRGWVPVAGVAVVGGVIAVTCFFAGMGVLGATRASIVSTAEPVVTVLATALVLGGTLSGLQWLGAALVVVGAIVGVRAHAGQDGAHAPVAPGLRPS